MSVALTVALGLLGGAGLVVLVALLRGPTASDRIVALDTLFVIAVSMVAVGVGLTGETVYVGILVVASLLGFVGTVTVARYLERRGGE